MGVGSGAVVGGHSGVVDGAAGGLCCRGHVLGCGAGGLARWAGGPVGRWGDAQRRCVGVTGPLSRAAGWARRSPASWCGIAARMCLAAAPISRAAVRTSQVSGSTRGCAVALC